MLDGVDSDEDGKIFYSQLSNALMRGIENKQLVVEEEERDSDEKKKD